MNDLERFERLMQRVCLVYDRKYTTTLADTWWDACEGLSDDQFESGVRAVLKTADRMPTPSAVRAAAYAAKEEQDVRMGEESGIPGVRLLVAGSAVQRAKEEGQKYAGAHLVESGMVTPLFTCRHCLDRKAVRVEAQFGEPHFGQSIPCPRCNGMAYDRYVAKHGVPMGFPAWQEA